MPKNTKHDVPVEGMSASGTRPSEYTPAGERARVNASFTGDQIATALAVDPALVRAAIRGEFGADAGARFDSKQAQHLAEVILGDQPLAEREAALLRLGAYVPRADQESGLDERGPGDEFPQPDRTAN